MENTLKIIHIEDNRMDALLMSHHLRLSGMVFEITLVDTKKGFIEALDSFIPDLIISDHSLPDFDSISAYKIMSEKRPFIPFILVTGSVSEQFAVECLLMGMDDYILKSNMIRLPTAIERVLSKKQITVEKQTIEKFHTELQDIYHQIKVKNEEITDSINYAKRIQDAILPGDEVFEIAFSQAFIYNKPRDIVSGDMYWLSYIPSSDREHKVQKMLAVIDCTGHGIPGAFMGLLSSVLLNETLKNKEIHSPGDVLCYLNRKLPGILNRNKKETINDGLDMVLCTFVNSRTVHFSGANRPLWVVRKNGPETELLEYKGTKASIGWHTPADQHFENTEVQLEKGDRLFLFTDGVIDQFGGEFGKKLTSKKLKEMLKESADMEFSDQKNYLCRFFADWQGTHEQTDDQLLVGIQID